LQREICCERHDVEKGNLPDLFEHGLLLR